MRTLAGKAQASIATMERLFGSLLDVSKLDAGAVRPDVGTVELGHLLMRAEETWAPQAAERGLRLRVRPTRLVARSDAELLERILGNLVSNALRYTSRGGVLVACRRRGEQCVLEVRDSGRGIAPEHQAAIFEEFFRIDAPGLSDEKGLGLGLSIVQRSAQLLGHELRVASRPGHGSVFRLTLPCIGEHDILAAADTMPGRLRERIAGTFIVVVDDDAGAREAMVDALRGLHCHVVAGASGDEACAALAGHLRVPDLVLADYRLGASEDGFQVIERMRRQLDELVPALVVTADTGAGLQLRAAAAGVALLHKPASLPRLMRAAVDAIGNAEHVEPDRAGSGEALPSEAGRAQDHAAT